jgi:tryptophan 7-halogenase
LLGFHSELFGSSRQTSKVDAEISLTYTKERIELMNSFRNVVIVGGGTTGYLAASMMSMHLKRIGVQATVIDTPVIGEVGLGEATVPSIHRLMENLGLTEMDFMRRCSATYKLAIQFKDWYKVEHEYWHPFGYCGSQINGGESFPYWLARAKRQASMRPFHAYSLQWNAALAGKSPLCFSTDSTIVALKSYAYHIDANAFSEMLKTIAVANGARVITGEVVDLAWEASDAAVSAVVLRDGTRIEGDLFLDCTEIHAVLGNGLLKLPFMDWSATLTCDRAIWLNLRPRPITPAFSGSIALKAGWAWFIPMIDRVECGYMYNSAFSTAEDAEHELITCAVKEGYSLAEEGIQPRSIAIRAGRLADSWQKNVIAIGTAACFIEPLEATAMHLSQMAVELLTDLFPCTRTMSICRDRFNSRMNRIYDQTRDFVHLHYLLSERRDSAFWQQATNTEPSPALAHLLDGYDACAWIEDLLPESLPATSYHFLLYGNRRLPRRAPVTCQANSDEDLGRIFNSITMQNERELRRLADHEEALHWIYRGGPNSLGV